MFKQLFGFVIMSFDYLSVLLEVGIVINFVIAQIVLPCVRI